MKQNEIKRKLLFCIVFLKYLRLSLSLNDKDVEVKVRIYVVLLELPRFLIFNFYTNCSFFFFSFRQVAADVET